MSGTLADLPGCGRAFAAVRYDLDLGTSADATGGAVDRLDLAASLVIAFADEADAVGRAVLEPEKASASAKLARAIKLSRADKCNLFFATFFIFGFSSCCVLLGTPVGYLSARVFRAGTACQAFSSFFLPKFAACKVRFRATPEHRHLCPPSDGLAGASVWAGGRPACRQFHTAHARIDAIER